MDVSPSSHADSWTPEAAALNMASADGRLPACLLSGSRAVQALAFLARNSRCDLLHRGGTAVFATLENQSVNISARVIIALVSIAAAVLAGLQTFLRLSETAAAHAQAGDWYAAIKRDIEQLRALRRDERGHAKTCTDTLRKEMNKVSQKSPELRESLWTNIAKGYGLDGAGGPPTDR